MSKRTTGFIVVDDGGWVLYANSVAQEYVEAPCDLHLNELTNNGDHYFTLPDGSRLQVAAMIVSLEWEGKKARAVSFEKKRASSARKPEIESKDNDWELTFDAVPDAIMILDLKGIIKRINKAAALLFGIEMQKAPGRSFCHLPGFHDMLSRVCPVVDGARAEPVVSEEQLPHAEGWVQISQMPLYDKLGRQKGSVMVLRDITMHKRVEQALQKAELRYRDIFTNAAIGIAQSTLEGRFLRVNPALSSMLGYASPTEMVIGIQNIREQVYADEKDRDHFLHNLMQHGRVVGFETRMRKKDGQIVWVALNCRLVKDDEENPRYLDTFINDITGRKEAEQAFQEQAQLLSGVLEGMEAAVFIVDMESHTIIEANAVAESLFGNKQEKILGRECTMLLASDGKKHSCHELKGPMRNIETTLELPNGEILPVQRTITPLEMGGKKLIVETMIDISERKALERQLTYTQKLESVGELAAGIAHEINTPIQYIGDNTRFLQDAFGDLLELHNEANSILSNVGGSNNPESCKVAFREALRKADIEYLSEEVPKAVQQTLEGVEHVSSIVKAMKQFSHPDTGESVLTDINKAIENTIAISRNEWKYHSQILTNLPDDLPLVECSPGDINQVLLNVLVNAAHAVTEAVGDSGDTGSIEISTCKQGDFVEISIRDTGAGIAPENRDRVFNPFFTTKEVGKGTGQGLAICYNIVVKKHAGSLDFHSTVGQGTTFYIRLPIRKQQEKQDAHEV